MAPTSRAEAPRTRTSAMRHPIGRDFKRVRAPRSLRALLPAALAVLASALALTSLRTQVLKLRYELAHQLEREQELRAEQNDRTVEMRTLREPRQLAQRAAELGFERPVRVIDLPKADGVEPVSSGPASEAPDGAQEDAQPADHLASAADDSAAQMVRP